MLITNKTTNVLQKKEWITFFKLFIEHCRAVPIRLITYELLTNAIKYAFTEDQHGEIEISLSETGINNGLVFRLSDNGIGNPGINDSKGTGFGTELVNLLVQQLDGVLTSDTSNGTITIHFKNRKPH